MSLMIFSEVHTEGKDGFSARRMYLKAMFAPPPRGVFFRRHVNHRHNVANLQGAECAH